MNSEKPLFTTPEFYRYKKKMGILKLLKYHSEARTQKTLDWIRFTITILTPSLVLLIGLQENPPPSECLLRIFLLISISLLTLTILIGLMILLGEPKGHHQALKGIHKHLKKYQTIEGLPFLAKSSWILNKLFEIFPILVWLSILSLGAFGILKYI